jgi:hypothetical protein
MRKPMESGWLIHLYPFIEANVNANGGGRALLAVLIEPFSLVICL